MQNPIAWIDLLSFWFFSQAYLRHLYFFLFALMLTPFNWKAVAKFRNPFILPAVYSLENSKYITEVPYVTGSTKANNHAEDTDENPSSRITHPSKKLDVPGKTDTIAKGGLIRHTRSNNNTCIKRYDHRIIYNHFFRIPICKRHKKCQRVVRIVRFFNGVTKAINYSCMRVWPLRWLPNQASVVYITTKEL